MKAKSFMTAILLLSLATIARGQPLDQFTPVVAAPLMQSIEPVIGTDGKRHAVYELRLINTRPAPATLLKIEVLDASKPSRVLAAYEGAELLARLRTLDNKPAADANIEFNGARQLLLHLAFDAHADIPARVIHRFDLRAQVNLGSADAQPGRYTTAPFTLSRKDAPVIGPPLAGKHWVALNGCCEADGIHRNSGLPVNGRIYYAQRFAIDWLRLDDGGRLAHGDLGDVRSYAAYGADVLAVADGVVVDALDTLDEQVPPNLPDPSTITLANADGNHVVLDIGNGLYAFYAHLQKGKDGVRMRIGERVRRGQVIGKLGNTGNSSAPHLHFHLMDSISVLGSNGLPYVIDRFEYAGLVGAWATALDQSLTSALFAKPLLQRRDFPLDSNVVNFGR